MTDLFTEIDEELRRQKLQNLWKEYGKTIIACAVILVLTTAGWNLYQYAKKKNQTAKTTALIEAVAAADNSQNIDELLALGARSKGAFRMISLFQAANVARKAGQTENLYNILEQIAQDRRVDETYRHLAKLMKLQHMAEDKEIAAADLLQQTDDFIAMKNNVWAPFALELKAQLHARERDYDAAIAALDSIQSMAETPLELYGRSVKLKEYFHGQKQITKK